MTDYQQSPDLLPLLTDTPQRIGRPLIAWGVITVLVVIAAGIRHVRPFTADPSKDDQASLLVMQMQAQYLVGAARTAGEDDLSLYYTQAKALNTGSVGQRLRFIVVAGELAGAKEALQQLEKLDQKLAEQGIQPTANQAMARDILGRLYDDYAEGDFDASSLREEEPELLRERHCGITLYNE